MCDPCCDPCDPCGVEPCKPDCCCQRPTKCNPCGDPCMPICGNKNPALTCRPGGRPWGRACGPVCFVNCQWIAPAKTPKHCRPLRIRGFGMKTLPYGFGLYARKIYPYGLPCNGNFVLPKPCCNKSFYPMLPKKPAKTYSGYTFKTRGAPYTCPRPCVSCCP